MFFFVIFSPSLFCSNQLIDEHQANGRSQKRSTSSRAHADLVKWQGTPIRSPLLRLPIELSPLAIECFECILRYCGDLPPDPEQTEVKCVYTVLMVSVLSVWMRWITDDYAFLIAFAALSQTFNTSRWSLLSIDETNDGQSINVWRFVATCMAIAQYFGSLFRLFGCIETIFDGTFDCGRFRSSTIIAWNGCCLSDEFT